MESEHMVANPAGQNAKHFVDGLDVKRGAWVVATLLLALVACACDSQGNTGATRASVIAPTSTEVAAPPTSTSTSVAATLSSTATSMPRVFGPHLGDPGDPELTVLFSIPVGEGATYQGGFEDWEVSGPQALTVSADGSIWVADTGSRRLLVYSDEGSLLIEVDTDPLGVGGLIDLAATADGVWGLEVIPALGRHRVLLFDLQGDLIREHVLPTGLHLEDGLSGIAATHNGQVWLEVEGGNRVYAAFDDSGAFAPEAVAGYQVDGLTAGPLPTQDGTARFAIGSMVVERPIREQGGITFEGSNPGWIVMLLSDVVFDESGALSIDLEVLYANTNGEIVAEARYPVEEVSGSAYIPHEFIAVGTNGRVLGLAPGRDGVDVLELVFSPLADQGG